MKPSLVDQYTQCAETCQDTDYAKPASVRARSRAVAKMRQLVKEAVGEGEQSIQTLATLLDRPLTREWLSFQLLETLDAVPPELERKCLDIIESIVSNPSRHADALGSQQWLEAWKKKRAARDHAARAS